MEPYDRATRVGHGVLPISARAPMVGAHARRDRDTLSGGSVLTDLGSVPSDLEPKIQARWMSPRGRQLAGTHNPS